MITSIIIFLVPFMVVAFLPLALRTISADDLDEMGICLEDLDRAISVFLFSDRTIFFQWPP